MSLSYWTGLFRRFRSFVLGRDVEIVGQCRGCGECCRGIMLRDNGRWLKRERQFRALCEDEPGYARFRIVEPRDSEYLSFACTLQGRDNLCTCYDERLPVCRNYPTKSLYYQGGWLLPDCGFSYKAVTFRDVFMRRKRARVPAFDSLLKAEIEQAKKRTP